MKAFHNDRKIKALYLKRVRQHRKLDEIVKGTYWENGKGCAVGCTIHSSTHKNYESELGLPEWLAMLEDRIFEGLPNGDAKEFPEQFLKAIPVGADVQPVRDKFLYWLLMDKKHGVVNNCGSDERVKKAVVDVGALLFRAIKSDEP